MRPFTPIDLEDFFEYASQPEVGPSAGWPPHADRTVTKNILREFIEKGEVWAIVWKETGKVIGSMGLHPDRFRNGIASRELGYVLSRDYWGRGVMTEAANAVIRFAFETLGLAALAVCHYPFNERSRRVIRKCGFTYEGTIRKAVRRYDGMALDECVYSMTREEYDAMK